MNVDKATRYHQLRRRAELAGTLVAGLFLATVLATGFGLRLREVASMATSALSPVASDVAAAVLMAGVLSLMMAALETPLAWYQGFALEHRYGLSTQRLGHWMSDHAKAVGIAACFAMLGTGVIYATLVWWPDWWWLLSASAFALGTIVIVRLAPVVLLPMFYTFRPLDRPALVSRLVSLAERANTSIAGVFEWGLSGHTRKANAALAGMGRTRRILLSDTLIAEYSEDEIEVVLAHELAHHVHHDLWRGVAVQTALLFGGFLIAHLALVSLGPRLHLSGLSDPAGLPLLMLVGAAWSLLLTPLSHGLSRVHERRADRFALETTGNAEAFVSAMRRLAQQNLAEERPSRLVQWLFYSHPPIRERIRAAEAWRNSRSSNRVALADHESNPAAP